MKTWLIIGSSRGIGLEFVRQILAQGDRVIATVRNVESASVLYQFQQTLPIGFLQMLLCDVSTEQSINAFIQEFGGLQFPSQQIDFVVLNAGILKYPNRATEMYRQKYPAQKLLATGIPIGTIMFMSSDSASATKFMAFEDGFAAYAASKSALNQALRHMAEELKRKNSKTVILAMHPGEVATDMANIDITWDIEGVLKPEESVKAMISVISSKGLADTGTFWTWEGKVHPW
ncbi:MAG: hypothetical protein GOMPHAMPRED_006697 [Gomphillus americanus]|uniref:Uncharacterized protein n=1 Tax=Gomphillus americanus TaxID=1940652 RepID=A0A8H3FXN9_9LECA|nr:MAG: hypothetical protein GOMPHAMPRED_006697 [Gomphillus americanus]